MIAKKYNYKHILIPNAFLMNFLRPFRSAFQIKAPWFIILVLKHKTKSGLVKNTCRKISDMHVPMYRAAWIQCKFEISKGESAKMQYIIIWDTFYDCLFPTITGKQYEWRHDAVVFQQINYQLRQSLCSYFCASEKKIFDHSMTPVFFMFWWIYTQITGKMAHLTVAYKKQSHGS